MIVLIDNYDSFSYNLYQLIGKYDADIHVYRNDKITVDGLDALKPDAIILSPGPGKPSDAGICEEVVKKLYTKYPILGVCLGHQAICEVYGATITYAKKLMHGKMSVAALDTECPVFAGIGETAEVARYHSLIAQKETIPECLQVIATTDDGEVMGVKHKEAPTYGLQFHPESILTPRGIDMLKNFLKQ